MRIRDPGWRQVGSGTEKSRIRINIPDPQHWKKLRLMRTRKTINTIWYMCIEACQNICALSKYLRAHIFSPFPGENRYLSRLISVLSLHFKFVHNHKSCPNWAATLLSPWIEAILAFGRGRWKLFKFNNGVYVGERGGGNRRSWPPLSCFLEAGVRGEGEGREKREQICPCTKCSLHAYTFTLCLSFSYLRSAATASFDIKKFHRNATLSI